MRTSLPASHLSLNTLAGLQLRDRVVAEHAHVVAPIAAALARRLPPSFDAEDLEGVGLLALVECAPKAAALEADHQAAYVRCRVRGAMVDSVKRGAYRDGTHMELLDAAPVATAEASPEDLAARAELEAVVAAAQRAVLTERQAQVLEFRRQGLTQKQTGEAMGGLRQPSVMQHERRAVEKLRQAVVTTRRRHPAMGQRLPLRPPLLVA